MEVLIFLILAACVFFGYAAGCNLIFRLLLRSLSVPPEFAREAKRERTMTFLVFSAVPFSGLGMVGMLILLVTYAVGIFRHFRERRQNQPALGLPRIPRMALSELMVMVFSLAIFPLVISAILEVLMGSVGSQYDRFSQDARNTINVTAFVVGALIFPLCFASAYHRLDGNRVPMGRARMLFLFIYPFTTFATHVIVIALFIVPILLFFAAVKNLNADNVFLLGLFKLLVAAAIVLAVGVFSAGSAKLDAVADSLKRAKTVSVPQPSPE